MAEENTIQERLTEIFDDPNIYTELRKKIFESIRNEIYYNSELKNTHFNEDPTVFEQFVDIFIEDILNDYDFRKYLKELNKLKNPESNPEKMYLFRRNNSGILPRLDIFIVNKLDQQERLTSEEEEKYNEYKQEEEKYTYNNQLALNYLNGYELNDQEQERLKEYFNSLISEEEALAKKRIENEPKIEEMRQSMKRIFFEDRLSMRPKLINSISDPLKLKEYEKGKGIFKGVNENTEFVRVEESSDKKSAHDFEVTSEYLIMYRKQYPIQGSYMDRRGHLYEIDHYTHILYIYMPPKENEYPEGTHLSDLIHKENMKKWTKQFEKVLKSVQREGAGIADIKKIVASFLKGEEKEIAD